ncbi:hypothetical protein [Phyllobacterium sp. P5_D12]
MRSPKGGPGCPSLAVLTQPGSLQGRCSSSERREHLKALLGLGISRFVQVHDPIQEAYETIAARAAQPVS